MIITGAVLAALAALLHVLIFYLESMAWTTPRARAIFGLTEQEADSTREMAFNQGFYNLFLAVEVLVGVIVTVTTTAGGIGLALTLAGTVSMSGAAACSG
ncbi:putative secreted protein [Corynebacterium variabile DSM 44702]|uniref:Putative secreted protein n=1 Tax=Corynebacterium variabile (strain DSM 44702 / CIP 107183 / JCM 12073 / NCIMB 30131) TaxID=858619 RepID=G0HAP6_CORVD|nr:putative secreted protein [Corynebacterium variabile DSM 44702]